MTEAVYVHLLNMNQVFKRMKGGGRNYRLYIQVIGHSMVVLRDSGSSRCGCMAIVEETGPGAVARVCIPHPC